MVERAFVSVLDKVMIFTTCLDKVSIMVGEGLGLDETQLGDDTIKVVARGSGCGGWDSSPSALETLDNGTASDEEDDEEEGEGEGEGAEDNDVSDKAL